jgi:hypothetical protein
MTVTGKTNTFVKLLGELSPSVMTRTEGTVFVFVKDTSPARDFSASRIRTRTHFSIPVKVKNIFGKYGEVKVCNHIGEGDEGSTQASLPPFLCSLPPACSVHF